MTGAARTRRRRPDRQATRVTSSGYGSTPVRALRQSAAVAAPEAQPAGGYSGVNVAKPISNASRSFE